MGRKIIKIKDFLSRLTKNRLLPEHTSIKRKKINYAASYSNIKIKCAIMKI